MRKLTAVGMALISTTLGLALSERDGVGKYEGTGSVDSHSSRGESA